LGDVVEGGQCNPFLVLIEIGHQHQHRRGRIVEQPLAPLARVTIEDAPRRLVVANHIDEPDLPQRGLQRLELRLRVPAPVFGMVQQLAHGHHPQTDDAVAVRADGFGQRHTAGGHHFSTNQNDTTSHTRRRAVVAPAAARGGQAFTRGGQPRDYLPSMGGRAGEVGEMTRAAPLRDPLPDE